MACSLPVVLVHSDGPMASSSLCALLDYLGYTSLPLRKLKLEEYIAGLRPISDPYIKHRIIAILRAYSKPSRLGGNSVLARNNNIPVVHSVEPDNLAIDDFLNSTPTSLINLVIHCCEFASQYLTYKASISQSTFGRRGFCLLTLPHPSASITQSFLDNAINSNDFKLLYLQRDFQPWLLSLLSQDFFSPLFRPRFLLNTFASYLLRHRQYTIATPANAFVLNTKDVLQPYTQQSAYRLTHYLSVSQISFEFPDSDSFTYDLYGRPSTFEHCFKPSPPLLKPLQPFISISCVASKFSTLSKTITVFTFTLPCISFYILTRLRLACFG